MTAARPAIPRRMILGAAAVIPAAAAAGLWPRNASGQAAAWPSRPVRLVVPFPAGGTTDLLARILSEPLGRRLGQPVVVENRPGAGGNIGADSVAKATDGHSLLMTTIGTAAINYSLYKTSMPYKPADLIAVTEMAAVPNIFISNPKIEAKTLAEVVALAKKKRDGLTIGSSGNGTSLHLTGELFREAAGIELVHVPFRGSAPMLTEVIAGRVDIAVDNLPSSLNHVRDGRLLGLAVTTEKRSPSLPDVQTTREAGFPTVDAVAWFGIQAPASTPQAVVTQLVEAIRAALQDPAVRARVEEQGAEPVGSTPAEFQAFIDKEIARWAEVIRKANVTLD